MPNANTPFDLRAGHDGQHTTAYRLLDVDAGHTEIASHPVSQLGAVEPGTISFSLGGLPTNSPPQTYDIEAVGPGGSVKAGEVVVTVTPTLPSPFVGAVELVENP